MTEPEKTPPPAPDWWDRLYAADAAAGPETHPAPDPDPDASPDVDEARPWWSVRRTAPETTPDPEPQVQVDQDDTGVHITINQPPPAAPAAQPSATGRRARIRWLVYHGTAAGVGWLLGLGPAIAAWLPTLGHGAPAAGIGLCLIACIPAVWLPGIPFIPPQLRPATVWLSRIPVATAALALALHAPGTVV